jgi:hypothetical protein
MIGLRAYYGNPVSSHADRHLELVGIGRMLSITPHSELGALACLRYQSEFGKNNVYSLPEQKEEDEQKVDKHAVAHERRGATLFGKDATYSKLASLIGKGAEIRSTLLTREFSFDDYKDKYGKQAVPLFALDTRKRIHVFTVGGTTKPAADWRIISLVNGEKATAEKSEKSEQAAKKKAAKKA